MIKSGKSPMQEAIVTVVLDEDKLEKAMKKHGYDSDAYFEFLYDIYGIEDGEDFQAGNTGLDLMFYSEDSKVKKLRKELGESVQYHSHSATESINESTYDGDTVNWNKISAGDVVGWTIEGMGKLPKVGDDFRVGPFIGKCTKVSGSKVYMKIESDSRELNESVYYVSGSTPTGEGDSNVDASGKITDPAKAIEQWFKLGAKHRSGTAITAKKKADAIVLVTWANENKDKITEWHAKYKCPYKLESILDGIANQVRRKCSSFYEGEFGDMVHPFDVG